MIHKRFKNINIVEYRYNEPIYAQQNLRIILKNKSGNTEEIDTVYYPRLISIIIGSVPLLLKGSPARFECS